MPDIKTLSLTPIGDAYNGYWETLETNPPAPEIPFAFNDEGTDRLCLRWRITAGAPTQIYREHIFLGFQLDIKPKSPIISAKIKFIDFETYSLAPVAHIRYGVGAAAPTNEVEAHALQRSSVYTVWNVEDGIQGADHYTPDITDLIQDAMSDPLYSKTETVWIIIYSYAPTFIQSDARFVSAQNIAYDDPVTLEISYYNKCLYNNWLGHWS